MSNQDLFWSINENHMNAAPGNSMLNGLRREKATCFGEERAKKPEIKITESSETRSSKMSRRKSSHQTGQVSGSFLHPVKTSSLSKSDQMLNQLLKDQLELAYIDHQNNIKSAQTQAALQLLRKSQPHLDVSPSNSRHSSPARNISSGISRRSHSPLSNKNSDGGWSSGSEYGYSSSPRITRIAAAGIPQSRSRSAHQVRREYQSAPCSPLHRAQEPAQRYGLSNIQDNLPNLINLVWNHVYDAVTMGNLLESFDEQDPKQWWKKLFRMLQYKHGKGMFLYRYPAVCL